MSKKLEARAQMEAVGSENDNIARPCRRELVSHGRRNVDGKIADEVEKCLQRRARPYAAVVSRFCLRPTHAVILQGATWTIAAGHTIVEQVV